MREGHSGLVLSPWLPGIERSQAGPEFAHPLSLYRTPLGPVLPAVPTGEKAAAGKPHKLALVACRQPSPIVGRNGCPLIAQTLHGDGNAICWVTQAGARHEDASRVPPQPRPCPAASCARKICHIALAVAELPLKLALACSADDR